MNLGSKPMFLTSSSASMKSGDGVSDGFPAGLRVLVVDDDPTCLMILEKMLKNCLYEVTKCNQAELALKYLRDNKNGFDIVISDVHMPDMDGFKLLELVGFEMDLPVIMMSTDDSKSVVMKGVIHGACDYLTKPVRMEALKNIWQHVVRKKKHEWKEKDSEQLGSVEGGEQQQKPGEDVDYSSSANEGNNSKKRKDEEDDGAEEKDDISTLKKPRVVWSVELHHTFMDAVNQLGIDKAVPKKILDLMKVPGLTRENVASHLQKYRLYLRRLSDASPQQIGLNNSVMGLPDATFGSISPLSGLDFHALAAGSQLPSQNFATIQAAALGRSATKSSISVPLVEQRNIFNLENPRLRIGEGQQQQNNNGKLINLLHGIPTNMDSKQLAALHQSAQSLGNMNMQVHTLASQNNPLMTQMVPFQPQSRPQSLNAINSNHVLNLPSNMAQSILSPAIPNTVLGRNRIDNVGGPVYTSISQPSNDVDFSRRQNAEFQGNSFSLLGNSSKGMLHDRDAEIKGPSTFGPNYDIFNELNQNTTQDWGMQNIRSTFDAPQHSNIQGGLGVPPSIFIQQGFSSNQKTGQIKNAIVNNGPNIDQNLNSSLAENGLRLKVEKLPNMGFQSGIFPEHFGQEEDLMSELLKQQEGIGPVENEFGFGGYHLDNLHA